MDKEIMALFEELKVATSVDWKAMRERLHEMHRRAETLEQRGALLAIHTAVMDQVERSGTMGDMEAFKKARTSDYNLFLISESTDGENVDPKKLLAVTQREIAAGRIDEEHELHKLAKVGNYVFNPPPPAQKRSWWSRLRGR